MSETTIITFEGLKGVGNVELDLRADQRVYAFIGTNGVGKTKLLEALFQLKFLSHFEVREHMKHSQLANECFVLQRAEGFAAGLQFNCDSNGVCEASLNDYYSRNHKIPTVLIGSNARAQIDRAQQQSYKIGTFEDRRAGHFDSQIAAMISDKFSYLGMGENISDWFVSRAQSGNPYQKEADNRSIEIDTLLSTLAKVDSRFDALFMEIAGANNVSLKVSGVVTELSHLSSGFASLVKMLQAIIAGYANFTNEKNITHVKGIVLIDEIESHLHIEWQSKIIPLLKELFPNTTFYVATHSALVLTQLQQGEAYLLKRDETDGVVRSEMIKAPDNQSLADLLNASFKVNLNELKKKQLLNVDQSAVKQKMLAMLFKSVGAT